VVHHGGETTLPGTVFLFPSLGGRSKHVRTIAKQCSVEFALNSKCLGDVNGTV
jgi:hypothetical protein